MYFFHVFENLAIVAPSITLWSAVQLTHITRALIKFSNWSYRGTTCERRKGWWCFKQNFNTLLLRKIKVSMTVEIRGIVFRLRHSTVVSSPDPVRNVSWTLFEKGQSSELRLRRGVQQAAHTPNNPRVECTGVLLCVIRE